MRGKSLICSSAIYLRPQYSMQICVHCELKTIVGKKACYFTLIHMVNKMHHRDIQSMLAREIFLASSTQNNG